MAKRALWLMNHTTLREFEVPMLIDMGFEVYCPNMFPYDEGNLSASIDRQYDSSLTVDPEIIDKLNQTNFYEELPRDTIELINKHFDIVFMGFFPEQFYTIVNYFRGVIIFQPFGLAANTTYTDVLYQTLGSKVFEALRKASGRFFFGQAYENLAEIECAFFKERAIYLPLGLKDCYPNHRWVGGDNRILFVCPRVYSSPYFNYIYHTFKKNFADYDYLIGGAQPINDGSDPSIIGFVDKQQYEYNMTHLAVMFYHSQEKRHLHYHPLEAIKNGMPLIFMAGGMLDKMGGKKLPGRCNSVKEARGKIDRIFRGDSRFIECITSSQEILLHNFTYEHCHEIWTKELGTVWKSLERNSREKRDPTPDKKIAVLLTEGYTGGVLDVTVRLVEAIHRRAQEYGSKVKLVFGFADKPVFKERDYFTRIRRLGISIRPFTWKEVDAKYIRNRMLLLGGFTPPIDEVDYCIMDDGMQYFDDCDDFIFVVDRCPKRMFITKPYIVLVHDYLQRYMTYMENDLNVNCYLHMAREAVRTFVMSPPTYNDAIMYAGLEKKRLSLIPLMFDLLNPPESLAIDENNANEEYFIWSTNLGEHKNHLMAIKALSEYYNTGGKLKCYMTGVGTDSFHPRNKEDASPYVEKVRNLIKKEMLEKHLVFCGNMSKVKYIQTLAKAKFFMHPGLMDNGNMTAVDAACLGVPTISSDYPQMRYYEEYMHLNMHFFDPYDEKSLADMLLRAEKESAQWAKGLPTWEELERYTIEETYLDIYAAVEEALKIPRGIAQ